MGGPETPVNLTTAAIGKAAPQLCGYLAKFKGDTFVDPIKLCGALLPNSDQIPSAP
jgi:hypothetical protein